MKRDKWEEAAREAWVAWSGGSYALFTRCTGPCGEIRHCRGRRRDRMLCLDCFDGGAR